MTALLAVAMEAMRREAIDPFDGGWIAAVGRHWYLDGIAPR
jgi:hypothetical protein